MKIITTHLLTIIMVIALVGCSKQSKEPKPTGNTRNIKSILLSETSVKSERTKKTYYEFNEAGDTVLIILAVESGDNPENIVTNVGEKRFNYENGLIIEKYTDLKGERGDFRDSYTYEFNSDKQVAVKRGRFQMISSKGRVYNDYTIETRYQYDKKGHLKSDSVFNYSVTPAATGISLYDATGNLLSTPFSSGYFEMTYEMRNSTDSFLKSKTKYSSDSSTVLWKNKFTYNSFDELVKDYTNYPEDKSYSRSKYIDYVYDEYDNWISRTEKFKDEDGKDEYKQTRVINYF